MVGTRLQINAITGDSGVDGGIVDDDGLEHQKLAQHREFPLRPVLLEAVLPWSPPFGVSLVSRTMCLYRCIYSVLNRRRTRPQRCQRMRAISIGTCASGWYGMMRGVKCQAGREAGTVA